jgi:ubiquinone/menaquinone biosynthesis C-methylase UbiE
VRDAMVFTSWIESLRKPFRDKNLSLGWLEGKECLDAGCGNGLYSVALAFLSKGRTVGVDISRGTIGEVKESFRGVENLEFAVANIEHLPFCDGSFDFVICLRVLHHIAHRDEVISELKRVLRVGGMLYTGDSLYS